jgi:IclR family mhp operon transcriptional activator
MTRATEREDPVRAVLRALDLLAEVNRQRSATLPSLLRSLGLPRATLIRLLGTLEAAGYVLRNPQSRRYEVTPRVTLLSAGFNFDAWLSVVATPILAELLGRIGWPSDVMMVSGAEIHVRASNRLQCGMSISTDIVGMRSPLARSASGRAHLAWSPERERERLLPLCTTRQGEAALLRELEETRRRGYGVRDPALAPQIGAIAVPVMQGDTVACCLDIVFLPRVEPPDRLAARCLPALRAAAAQLEAAVATLDAHRQADD